MVDYLAGIVPVTVGEFLAVILFISYYRHCRVRCHPCRPTAVESDDDNRDRLQLSLSDTRKFHPELENSYLSIMGRMPLLQWVLAITRLCSFGYLAGCSVLANFIVNNPDGWHYFTNWNTILLSIYFLFATTFSIIGLSTGELTGCCCIQGSAHTPTPVPTAEGGDISTDIEDGGHSTIGIELMPISSGNTGGQLGVEAFTNSSQPPLPETLPSRVRSAIRQYIPDRFDFKVALMHLFHVMFEVCGGTACLVTVVAFGVLNHAFTFWNVSLHFVTVVTMVVELALNSMYVRLDHYPFNMGWGLAYLIFIWPTVCTGVIKEWPYFFLHTDTYYSFFFYTGLLIANFLFYLLWFGLSELKYLLRTMCMKAGRDPEMAVGDGQNSNVNSEKNHGDSSRDETNELRGGGGFNDRQ